MSTDDLRRHITRHLEYLRALQGRELPPVTCIMARLEGCSPNQNYTPRQPGSLPVISTADAVMADALFHPSHRVTSPRRVTNHFGGHGGYVTLFTTLPQTDDPRPEWQDALFDGGTQDDRYRLRNESIGMAEQACKRLSGVIHGFLPSLVERFGLDRYSRTSEWLALLFHLGWHFPAHGIDAGRYRILSAPKRAPCDFVCRELSLQLGGGRISPDVFPGVILSRLGEASDFLTSSVNALLLILEALDGIERDARPEPCPEFTRLHESFSQLAETYSHHPRELSVKVLRLADSFRTPPATEWAGIDRGGDGWGIPKYYVLSQLDC